MEIYNNKQVNVCVDSLLNEINSKIEEINNQSCFKNLGVKFYLNIESSTESGITFLYGSKNENSLISFIDMIIEKTTGSSIYFIKFNILNSGLLNILKIISIKPSNISFNILWELDRMIKSLKYDNKIYGGNNYKELIKEEFKSPFQEIFLSMEEKDSIKALKLLRDIIFNISYNKILDSSILKSISAVSLTDTYDENDVLNSLDTILDTISALFTIICDVFNIN